MKIATYNINGIKARLPVLLRWLEETTPDIACLQELKCPQENFPAYLFEQAGYNLIWHGQKSWNGVAILSRKAEIKEICRALPGDPEDLHSRYIEADVKGIRIACLYLPNGNPAPGPKYDYKMQWMERLHYHATDLLSLEKPVILAGDFNVIPTEQDVYKPERVKKDALFLPETRSAYDKLVALGWTDAIRKLHQEDKIFTFWDYFRNAYARNAGMRIDHFLLSPQVTPQLKACGVDTFVRGWEKSSDHAPVWIEIQD